VLALLKRIIFEFWLAFVVAAIWAILRAWPFQVEWTWLGTLVANFSVAFFLVSYMIGQYVRIRRQRAVEQRVGTAIDRLVGVTVAVSELTDRLNEYLTQEPASLLVLKELSVANNTLAHANDAVVVALREMCDLQLEIS